MANENAITKIQLKTKISPITGDNKVELSQIDLAQGEPLVNTNNNTLIIGTSSEDNPKANDSRAIILGYSSDSITTNNEKNFPDTNGNKDKGVKVTHKDGNKDRYTRTIEGKSAAITADDAGNIQINATYGLSANQDTADADKKDKTANLHLVDSLLNDHSNVSITTKGAKTTVSDGNIEIDASHTLDISPIERGGATFTLSANNMEPCEDNLTTKNVVASSSASTQDSSTTGNGVYLNHLENDVLQSSHKISGTWSKVTSDNSGNITINSTPDLALVDGDNTVNVSITGPNNTGNSESVGFSVTGNDYTRVDLDGTSSVKISSVIGSHVTIGNADGEASGGWYKVASGLVSVNDDASFIFNVITAYSYNNTYAGTLKFWIRTNDTDDDEYYKENGGFARINWIDRVSSTTMETIDENSAVVFYKLTENKSRYWELFMYLPNIAWFLTTVELVSARTRDAKIPYISFNSASADNYGQDLNSLKVNMFNNWFNDNDHKEYSDNQAKINHITDYHFIESVGQSMLFHSVDVESGCTFGSKDSSIELKADTSSPYLKLKNTKIQSTSNGLKITVT